MNDAWIKDVIAQKFLNSDITRIIVLRAFVQTGVLCGAYKKSTIMEYVYRVFSDYEEIRSIHPDARIRNINRYGITDLKYVLETALKEWQEYAINDVLVHDERYIYLRNIAENEIELGKYTLQLSNMLLKKYFAIELHEPLTVKTDYCKEDWNLETFGQSLYRNRVFEDIQYCPLCEEVDTNMLRVVHILPACFCEQEEELIDKNNGLILCKYHAKDYVDKKFYFEENGFARNICSSLVSNKMHLAIQIKNRQRREYIRRYKVALIRNEGVK